MKIIFAKNCAWRAMYIYIGGPMRFSIGIDPTFRPNRARMFGAIGYRRDCTGGHRAMWHWGFNLPRSKHWRKLDRRHR